LRRWLDDDGLSIYRLGCLVARGNDHVFDRLGRKHYLKVYLFVLPCCEICFLNLARMLEKQCFKKHQMHSRIINIQLLLKII
jgi:hypothetical protein